jgi:serine/threonine-protein kinase RsbW
MTTHPRTIELDSHYAELRRIGPWLRKAAGRRLQPDVIEDLELAATEAVANIIRHAYGGQPGRRIVIRISFHSTGAELLFEDEGNPPPSGLFDHPPSAPAEGPVDIASLSESGRGLAIIHGCVNEVRYARHGATNELRLAVRDRTAS